MIVKLLQSHFPGESEVATEKGRLTLKVFSFLGTSLQHVIIMLTNIDYILFADSFVNRAHYRTKWVGLEK